MMRIMKALVLESPNVLRYKDIPVPVYGDDEILIKMITACICNGSDPAIISGATWSDFPAVFGHEAFGEITAVGRDVTDYKVGDRISWWFTMGAFAEYAVINPGKVAVVVFPLRTISTTRVSTASRLGSVAPAFASTDSNASRAL